MNIKISWDRIELRKTKSDEFEIDGLKNYEGVPGVYIFCREYNGILNPVYVGKGKDIARRLCRNQQMNNHKLLKGIEQSGNGEKVLYIGKLSCKGDVIDKCLRVTEKALIEYAIELGYALLNINGVKEKSHTISFTGDIKIKSFTGNTMTRRTKLD